MLPIILASSSPYRRQLLEKLQLPFECDSPSIDEAWIPGEEPALLVSRLSERKARTVAGRNPAHLIIASDQVASLQGHILNKPHTYTKAQQQLRQCSGKTVTFYTGLSLLNSHNNTLHQCFETFSVQFRTLTQQTIDYYLSHEQVLDCAGSFKMEGLGIALFEKLCGDDPNSLIGLPLIKLIDLLAREGVNILGPR